MAEANNLNDDGSSVPSEEGFRDPPDWVTEPCLTYMARVMELREFVGFYFNFVKSSSTLAELIPDEVKQAKDAEYLKILEYSFSRQRPIVNQILLSRAVESFDLYLTTVMRDVFISKPEILKSEGKVDISLIIDAVSYEDLIWEIVNKKLHQLSYKSLSELRKYIYSRTGVELFGDEDVYEKVLLASEIRNLIAHNDCVQNEVFKTRTQGIKMPLEVSDTGRISIDDSWMRTASYALDGTVFDFDEQISKKFELRTLHRMTSFLYRG